MSRLTPAFIELSLAERNLARGDRSGAKRSLGLAQTRLERAASARDGAHALHERSDDIRSTLRILEEIVEKLRTRIERGGKN